MLTLNPSQIPSAYKTALRHQQRGESAKARVIYTAILAARPRTAEVLFQLARMDLAEGKAAAAIAHLDKALAIKPGEAALWRAYAEATLAVGSEEMRRQARNRIKSTGLPAALSSQLLARLGAAAGPADAAAVRALLSRQDPKAALTASQALVKSRPRDLEARLLLAEAQGAAGQSKAALATLEAAIRSWPKAVKPRADRAYLLQQTGEFEAAEKAFRATIKAHPEEAELYRMFVATKKLKADDPLIPAMERRFSFRRTSDAARIQYGYALAKAMEDTGQYDRVFDFLKPANDLMRAAYPYDVRVREAEVARLIAAFDGFGPLPELKGNPFAPIFVTGMPRSGTTLVEQIIARHPDVTAGGESAAGIRAAYEMFGDGRSRLTPGTEFTEASIRAFADRYETEMRARLEIPDRATDKSIQSHLIVGLLAAAFPKGRIVIVHRDPRDTCLSIYKNYFAPGTHRYATDLADLGRYYRSFGKMAAYWRRTMPDRIYEVTYESLIAEPEKEARALIAACDLTWHDACLDHTAGGPVRTLSLHQVRQPIYRSSVRAWERYADHLAPLFEALQEGGHGTG